MRKFIDAVIRRITVLGEDTSLGVVTQYDRDGSYLSMTGTSVPTAGTSGFAKGATFIKTDNSKGVTGVYTNVGTTTSCLFQRADKKVADDNYGIVTAGRHTSVGGDTAEVSIQPTVVPSDAVVAVQSATDDTDKLVASATAHGEVDFTGSADPLTAHGYDFAVIRQNPLVVAYEILAYGEFTWSGGGATVDETISGVTVADIVVGCISSVPSESANLEKLVTATDKISAELSAANTSNDAKITYMVLRPKSDFTPAAQIIAAGEVTTAGGDVDEAISVSGMLATDKAIVSLSGTDDTDHIVQAVPAAGQIDVELSANPGTTHKLSYAVLRDV